MGPEVLKFFRFVFHSLCRRSQCTNRVENYQFRWSCKDFISSNGFSVCSVQYYFPFLQWIRRISHFFDNRLLTVFQKCFPRFLTYSPKHLPSFAMGTYIPTSYHCSLSLIISWFYFCFFPFLFYYLNIATYWLLKWISSGHCCHKNLQRLLMSLQIKVKCLTMIHKVPLGSNSSTYISDILLLFSALTQFLLHWPPSFPLVVLATLLPKSYCICCPLYLGYSFPRYPYGSFNYLLQVLRYKIPYQWVLLWPPYLKL